MRIELNDLTKTYRSKDGGAVTAVNGISLSIPQNTVFGIIGKSGAGKSSLVRLMSLLEKPDTGSVCYDGERVDTLEKRALIARRRRIGMIFQNFNLFSSRTAGKNIAYPLEICGVPKSEISARVREMLSLVGLSDRADAPISTLSGGQKQRVAIARALAPKPDILFCDEATSALDPQTTRSILELIRSLQKQLSLTVVMITHQMEVVRDACEQVAVIDGGAVVEQGLVSDLFTHPKTAITRDFIRNIRHSAAEQADKLVQWAPSTGGYLLRFAGESTARPILSQLAKRHAVDFNILAAGVETLRGEPLGTMLVDFDGDEAAIRAALAWLGTNGVTAQALHADVAAAAGTPQAAAPLSAQEVQ